VAVSNEAKRETVSSEQFNEHLKQEAANAIAGWKKGPMPKETWLWGGVVPVGESVGGGFFFADFHGDHVLTHTGRRIEAADVAWYNNSIGLPPRQ